MQSDQKKFSLPIKLSGNKTAAFKQMKNLKNSEVQAVETSRLETHEKNPYAYHA